MANWLTWILALVLTALGAGIFAYKHFDLHIPVSPDDHATAWTVEARVSFEPDRNLPIKVRLRIPEAPPNFQILDETFASPGYGISLKDEERPDGSRISVWTKRRADGEQTLYYRALVVPGPGANEGYDGEPPLPPEVPNYEEPFASAAEAFLQEIREDSADVNSFTAQLLRRLHGVNRDETIELLLDGAETPVAVAERAILLLQGARIPSRIVMGFMLDEAGRFKTPRPLIEVHNGEQWTIFNPLTAEEGLPTDFFVWSVGSTRLLDTENVYRPEISFSAIRTGHPAVEIANRTLQEFNEIAYFFSLSALPVDLQNVYAVLLLVPLGALIVVLFRNVVGISTTGTFAPVLLALSFRETQLGPGITLFIIVVSVGLTVRLFLERLKMLVVPRIAAVIVVVIALMLLISMISNAVGFRSGLSVALFPMIILAWIIERMSIVWEEEGPREVLFEGTGTLFVASTTYLVVTIETIRYAFFTFPELLLVVLAVILLLGRYTGYRLTELFRFNALKGARGS